MHFMLPGLDSFKIVNYSDLLDCKKINYTVIIIFLDFIIVIL